MLKIKGVIRSRFSLVGLITAVALACSGPSPSNAEAKEGATGAVENGKSNELKRVLDRMLAPPRIQAEPGFSARVLIAPGKSPLYDPLFMRDHGDAVWISDDGGLEGEKGGQILSIDARGKVSNVVALGRLIWVHGFDIAPASFGAYRGQIFTESSAEAGSSGIGKGGIVYRLDLTAQRDPQPFCTLPPAGGPDGKGIPAWGGDALFGPEGSPFAGKFFTVTTGNGTVYQVTPDGRCTLFVTFDPKKWGLAWGLAFTPDGQHMLVSMVQGEKETRNATIARVRSDGTIEAEALVRVSPNKLLSVFGMAYAPAGFRHYAGELFIATNDAKWFLQYQGKSLANALPEAGEVYRLTRRGELKRVASGFRGAVGIHFVGGRLWVSDINGDFLGRVRELPDGFVVEITPTP